MGLFGNNNHAQLPKGWEVLSSSTQLSEVDEASKHRPVVIFKHSTRCSISSFAYNFLEKEWQSAENLPTLYYLDLLEHREISNTIAERYHVEHQSPQVIVVQDGKAVWDASHNSITELDISEFA